MNNCYPGRSDSRIGAAISLELSTIQRSMPQWEEEKEKPIIRSVLGGDSRRRRSAVGQNQTLLGAFFSPTTPLSN